ncbi:MAG TPA: flagellar hook capping FlgD N-terminal domain-containing protein [Bryobacteraceae bacterium]|nr:flagellar hook capping FlgD N-terminal domain-containing protein [Bryobacteraceae bacterium]
MISGTNPTAVPPPPTAGGQQKLIPAGNDQLANKETFLQLLVAQIKNQNPLNPSDGAQFLSQLAQFSDLEQTMSMRKELEGIHAVLDKIALPPGPAAVPSNAAVK